MTEYVAGFPYGRPKQMAEYVAGFPYGRPKQMAEYVAGFPGGRPRRTTGEARRIAAVRRIPGGLQSFIFGGLPCRFYLALSLRA